MAFNGVIAARTEVLIADRDGLPVPDWVLEIAETPLPEWDDLIEPPSVRREAEAARRCLRRWWHNRFFGRRF